MYLDSSCQWSKHSEIYCSTFGLYFEAAAMTEDVAPWQLPAFQSIPSCKKDYWTILPRWVVRAHGKLRSQPCLPLHETFPLHQHGGESLSGHRVTVAFYEGQNLPVVIKDSWTASPSKESRAAWKGRGKWSGFTFFERTPEKTIDPTNEHPTNVPTMIETNVDHTAAHLAALSLGNGYGYQQGGAAARGKAALHRGQQQNDRDLESEFEIVGADD